ncbi:MAG: hypothetical protein MUE65_03805 [Methanomassiliicoccales archaeon]|nr:hypothetical protein [Methanomassiliicoccales archaeon]
MRRPIQSWWGSLSFKERMLDRMELHALSAYDNELCEALRRHLGTFAIEAREAMPGTPECMHRRVLMDHSRILISSLKVSGRSFGQVDVSQYTGGGHRGGTYTWYWFGYLVPRRVDRTLKEGVAAQLHLMKKGLLHRETAGHEWRGEGPAAPGDGRA